MKRDIDLVREILIACNDYEHGNAPANLQIDGYPQAVVRASKMDQDAEAAHEPHRNPSTGVYKLTELIRG